MESKEISKKVLDRKKVQKVLNLDFETFTDPEPEVQLSVSEFFNEYERLFTEIPIEGETESHRFLVNRSKELLDFDTITDDIEPLLQEISFLRRQLLNARTEIVNLQVQLTGDVPEPIEELDIEPDTDIPQDDDPTPPPPPPPPPPSPPSPSPSPPSRDRETLRFQETLQVL